MLRALVALWFVLSVGEPSVVHFCPMHGGMLVELVGAAPMSGMAMQGAAHPEGSTASRRAAEHGAQEQHAPDGQHHCTCIDCCVGAGGVAALPSAPVAPDPATWTLAAGPVVPSAATLPRPGPPHAQPPGTGPPRI